MNISSGNRKLPIGIQSFEFLRTEGYLYVDKTALIYRLATMGKPYFLSRPRRFGKSLLLSTLEANFQGKKELFKGLAIERLEQDWYEYPVLHLDLNAEKYDSKEALAEMLERQLKVWEERYETGGEGITYSGRFMTVIRKAYEKTGRRVVALIDEYDKPMLRSMHDEALQKEFRETLTAFYTVLKDADPWLQFVFITGVTKFAQELRKGDTEAFLTRLRAFFADIPYELNDKTERHYQVIFYLVFKLMGQYTEAEVRSAKGRADTVVKTSDYIHVFEFKLNGTAEEAMRQIDDKGYLIPYSADNRSVVKIGAAFDKQERNIGKWLVDYS